MMGVKCPDWHNIVSLSQRVVQVMKEPNNRTFLPTCIQLGMDLRRFADHQQEPNNFAHDSLQIQHAVGFELVCISAEEQDSICECNKEAHTLIFDSLFWHRDDDAHICG